MFATAKSARESTSALKLPITTEAGEPPTAKLVGPVKPPVPSPSRIETLAYPVFGVARSERESPLKSPTATERGLISTAKLVGPLKPPVPSPSRIETLLERLFATARSGFESLLKCPIATDTGASPAGKLVGPVKPPDPSPSRIETLSEYSFATAKSGRESPSKSPIATDVGPSPTANLVWAPKTTAWAGAVARAVVTAKPNSALPSHRGSDEILAAVRTCSPSQARGCRVKCFGLLPAKPESDSNQRPLPYHGTLSGLVSEQSG